MRTPAVLVCIMIVSYIFQEIFQLIGIETFAAIFSVYKASCSLTLLFITHIINSWYSSLQSLLFLFGFILDTVGRGARHKFPLMIL